MFTASNVIKRSAKTLASNTYLVKKPIALIDLYHLNFIKFNRVSESKKQVDSDGYFSYLQPMLHSDKISCEYKRRLWLGGTVETFLPMKISDNGVGSNVVVLEEVLNSVKKVKNNCVLTYTRNIVNETDKSVWLKEKRQLFFTTQLFSQRTGNNLDFVSFNYTDISADFLFTDQQIIEFSHITANPHYIHLNAKYNKEVEGYPEKLVVQGPYLLTECIKYIQNVLGKRHFAKIEYRIKQNLFANEKICMKLNTETRQLVLGSVDLGTILFLSYT